MIWIAIVFIFLQTSPGHVDTVVGLGYGPTGERCEQLAADAIKDAKLNPQYAGSKYTCNPVELPEPPKVA